MGFAALAFAFQLLGPGEEVKVRELVTRYEEAQRSNDASDLASLYSADAMLLPANEPGRRGRAEIERFWRSQMRFRPGAVSVTVTDVKAAENLAYVVGTLSNGRGSVRTRFVLCLERQIGAGWVITTEISNEPRTMGYQPLPS